jgi:phospholipase C
VFPTTVPAPSRIAPPTRQPRHRGHRGRRTLTAAASAGLLIAAFANAAPASAAGGHPAKATPTRSARVLPGRGTPGSGATATPIKHVVVVFQENVSFDHYFGTYPHAANTDGTRFVAAPNTPSVNGLSGSLLTSNPNGMNPARLTPGQALTCDQDHDYTAEQLADDHGAMDKFIQYTQKNSCQAPAYGATDPHLVLDYYDGNTVTALWNYAQHFAMSDNSYGTTFGPSTPGALNLVSGQTAKAYAVSPQGQRTLDAYAVPNQAGVAGTGTVINDPDPAFDRCSNPAYATAALTGKNIGDLLTDKGVSWGWFQGGFGDCAAASEIGRYSRQHGAGTTQDYSAHHEPFQYYRSTANPAHTPPASLAEVGHAGPANHQYDLSYFGRALKAGKLPAVSFVKAKKSEDGHAAYSDPLDEQHFLVDLINQVQRSKDWKDTAIVVAYDDSDGWYDHQMSPIVNHSQSTQDALTGPGQCGTGGPILGGYQLRCGYGPRLPLLVISPFAKVNAVDSSITDQTSILRLIEDNWRTGRIGDGSFDAIAGSLGNLFDFGRPAAKRLFLDPNTGAPVRRGRAGHH